MVFNFFSCALIIPVTAPLKNEVGIVIIPSKPQLCIKTFDCYH